MNRRAFLKAAAYGIGGAAAVKSGLVFAGKGLSSSPLQSQYNLAAAEGASRFIHPTMASNSLDPVGVRLVCWFDVSGSIDNNEYDAQLEAMASAIRSQDFQDAVYFSHGPQSLAICVADFGSSADIRIPWLDIRKGDKHKFHQLADEITGLTRRETGSTSHISALGFSMDCLDNCPWEATRTVVDVMTDGKNNTGGSNTTVKSYVKNLAEDYEATVNALVTVTSSERDLDEWARKTLVTPGGFIKQDGRALDRGFVKVVARQDNGNTLNKVHDAMRIAFREKLILEVADLELDNLREQVTKERRAGPLGLIQRLL